MLINRVHYAPFKTSWMTALTEVQRHFAKGKSPNWKEAADLEKSTTQSN